MANPSVPRLKDVAQAANVSLAAASRILRGDRKRFGEDTCRRVIEASRQLGWRRNLLVNGMQTGRTQTVGVMIPPLDPYWVSILSGIHDALFASDHLPITVWIGRGSEMPELESDMVVGPRLINRLLDRRVDGLIMWPQFCVAYHDRFLEFVERRVPVVVVDHYSTVADSVETDEQQATAAVADHLLQLGHRRIACLTRCDSPWEAWAAKRRHAFEQAVQRCPDAVLKSWQLNTEGTNGREVARELLTDELRPTAVFAVSDREAKFVHEAATEMNMKIPRDLSLVGFADLNFAARMTPPLTTVRQQPYEVGRRAAKLLLDRIDGILLENDSRTTVKVAADLIVRKSTAAPRVAH